MPNHRNEPAIYTGKVMMMMGDNAGELEPMDYGVAQAMVANGNARWEGDDTPMPRHLADKIARRKAEREAEIAADAAHAANLDSPESGAPLVDGHNPNARALAVVTVDGVHYMGRPFPQAIEFVPEIFTRAPDGIVAREENFVSFRFANANAVYEIKSETPDFLYAELHSKEEPEVEIPADWQTLHHMTRVGLAKKVRALDNSVKMTKDEADAILTEWTTPDDTLPADDAGGTPAAETNENGRKLDGNHAPATDGDGNPAKPAEEIAAENQRRILHADDF